MQLIHESKPYNSNQNVHELFASCVVLIAAFRATASLVVLMVLPFLNVLLELGDVGMMND